jgi:hypothetical protein
VARRLLVQSLLQSRPADAFRPPPSKACPHRSHPRRTDGAGPPLPAGVVIEDEAAAGAGATAAASRRALADVLLSRLGVAAPAGGGREGGARGGARLVARRQLGSVVHVFSHIRQTSHVEQLVLEAPSLTAACAAAGVGAARSAGGGGKGEAAAEKKKRPARRGADTGEEAAAAEEEEAGAAAGEGGGAGAPPALRWVSQRELRAGDEGLTSGVRKVLALAHALGGGEGKAKGGAGKGKKAAAAE